MSDLIAVSVVDLKAGPALDWAVAKAVGVEVKLTTEFASLNDGGQRVGMCCFPVNGRRPYKPSTDWSQGGQLISQHIEQLSNWESCWSAMLPLRDENGFFLRDLKAEGSTALEAAMRAIVAAKFGDAVTVPKALVERAE